MIYLNYSVFQYLSFLHLFSWLPGTLPPASLIVSTFNPNYTVKELAQLSSSRFLWKFYLDDPGPSSKRLSKRLLPTPQYVWHFFCTTAGSSFNAGLTTQEGTGGYVRQWVGLSPGPLALIDLQ